MSLLFRRNHKFVGRTDILHDLERRLFLDEECHEIAVYSLGGIGKTQIALEFANFVSETHQGVSVLWIVALSQVTVEKSFMEIAGLLGLHQESSKQDGNQEPTVLDIESNGSHASRSSNQEDVKQLVKRHLEAQNRSRWLLIVDNVDDERLIDMLLTWVPHSTTGRTLYTSRSTRVVQDLVGSDAIEIEKLEELDAINFMKRSVFNSCPADQDDLRSLLQDLDYFPLALTQAAAYMNQNRVSPAKYRQLLGGTDQGLIRLMSAECRDRTRYQDVGHAIATTWVVSFDQILAQDPVAAELFRFISCIEWRDIPLSILPGRGSATETMERNGTLCSYSFLSPSERSDAYTMHRLVHLATQIWVGQYNDANAVLSNALAHLNSVFPFDYLDKREQWRAYLPHAIRILDNAVNANNVTQADLCFRIGRALRTDRRYQESLQWLDRCHLILKIAPDHGQDRLLATQQELARAYQQSCQFPRAIMLMEHVVAVRRESNATHVSIRLRSEALLGWIYVKAVQIGEGVAQLESVVHQMIKLAAQEEPWSDDEEADNDDGSENEDSCSQGAFTLLGSFSMDTMDTTCEEAGRLIAKPQDSCDMSTRHQTVVEENQWPASGKQEVTPERLGHLNFDKGALNGIGEELWISTLRYLANAYLASAEPDRVSTAIALLELVQRMWASSLPETSAQRIDAEYSLVRAYLTKDQPSSTQKAITLMQHIVDVELTKFHANDYERLHGQHQLASACLKSQQPEQRARGVDILETALAHMTETLREYDFRRLSAENTLAIAYLESDEPETIVKAIRLWEHVIDSLSRTDGSNISQQLQSAQGLAMAYLKNGSPQAISRAVKLLQHAVRTTNDQSEENDPFRLEMQRLLAEAYLKTDQLENVLRAIELLENLVDIQGRTLGVDEVDRDKSQELLVEAYKAREKFRSNSMDEHACERPSKRGRSWTVVEFFRGSFITGTQKMQKI